LYDLGIWLLALLVGGEKRFRMRVIDEAGPLEGAKVLEIFSGTATLSLMATDRGANVTAIDISAGMLRVAGEKARKAGHGVGLVRGEAIRLPFKSGSFDTVMVSLGLHEAAARDVPVIAAEAHRVLKDSGRLVIFDFHRAEGRTGAVQKVFFSFFEDEDAWTWLATDVQTLLREAGFSEFRRKFLNRGVFQLITVEKRGTGGQGGKGGGRGGRRG
jgi:ubiquinone/menaquinone biosynthesis C-methylase UbiE